MVFPRILSVLGALVIVSACSKPPQMRQPLVHEPMPERELIAEVRRAGADSEDAIEVHALQDPVIADLLEAAAQQEHANAYDSADAIVRQALELAPGDPELLQWRAELALAMGQLDDAVRLANASWETGPRLGSLCRRNWATIRLARELSELPDAAEVAATQAARCTIAPPVRM